MKVAFTTVIRGADNFVRSGRIIEMDLSSSEIIMSMNLPDKGEIVGQRGGSRGGRGIQVFNDKIFVAIYDRILVYDRNWRQLSEIRHPHVVGHHEIRVDINGIWCCSTLTDAIVMLDFKSNALFEWWASEDDGFVTWTNSKLVKWDRSVDYSSYHDISGHELHPNKQFHLNNVCRFNQTVYAFDANNSALFAVWPKFKPVVINPAWDHAHNVCLRGRDVLVNNSARKTFEAWRIPGTFTFGPWRKPFLLQRVEIFPGEHKASQFSQSGWVRGRIDVGWNEFIVGSNPASLFHIKDHKVINSWNISDNINEAIHGLAIKDREIKGNSR